MLVAWRIITTRLGAIGFSASQRGLRRVFLMEPDRAALRAAIRASEPDSSENADLLPEVARALVEYFAGEPVRFKVPFDWPEARPFETRVWRACHAIPYGATQTYGALAATVGSPGAARAVGTAMKRNRCPIVVPCHRVTSSGGGLGGYSGPGGVGLKRDLLEMEAAAIGARL